MDIVEKLRIELASLPKGYISNKTIGGKVRHYLQWTENGKIKSRYIKDSEYEEIKAKVARRKELAELLKSLEKAEEEGDEIVRTAIRKAQLKEETILREADEKAARVLARAEEQIELEKKQAVSDIKDEVSGMAISIASAVIARDVSEEEHAQLIDDFISKMGDEND